MTQTGRPRGFDTEQALDRAMEVFWRHGYEGASLTELTGAMGINKPSLYAAFGNKEGLFRTVVARYAEFEMAYARDALDQPTARDVAATLLRENVVALTRPDRPAGCLSIQGATACSTDNAAIASFLAASRLPASRPWPTRFARAVDEGDLPPEVDPTALARFLSVVTEGHAVHAAAGVSREGLWQTAEIALVGFAAASGAAAARACRRPGLSGWPGRGGSAGAVNPSTKRRCAQSAYPAMILRTARPSCRNRYARSPSRASRPSKRCVPCGARKLA